MLMLVHLAQVDLGTPTTPPPAPLRCLAVAGAAGGVCKSCFGCTRMAWPLGGRNGRVGGVGGCVVSASLVVAGEGDDAEDEDAVPVSVLTSF